MEVAKLTAPIKVTIPYQQIQKFQNMLNDIADTLELIVTQFKDIDKETKKSMKNTVKGIKGAEDATEDWQDDLVKIIKDQKKIQDEQKKTKKGANRVARAWGSVANVVAKIRVGVGLLKFVFKSVMKVIAAPILAGAGFLGLAVKVNQTTAEMVRLSEAVGMNVNDMNALALAAKDAGFTFEHVNSLIEEWNNKLAGEKGGFEEGQLREGLVSLGIALKDIIKLKPDQALEKIMNAGQKLAKEGRLDEFSSAVDKIYGQEANRLMTSWQKKLVEGKMTFVEMRDEYKKYVSISEKAQKGALLFTSIWNKALASVKSSFMEFFGEFGDRLKNLTKPFEGFIKSIGTGLKPLKEFFLDISSTAVEDLFNSLQQLARWSSKPGNMENIEAWTVGIVEFVKAIGETSWDWVKNIVGLFDTLLTTLEAIKNFAAPKKGAKERLAILEGEGEFKKLSKTARRSLFQIRHVQRDMSPEEKWEHWQKRKKFYEEQLGKKDELADFGPQTPPASYTTHNHMNFNSFNPEDAGPMAKE